MISYLQAKSIIINQVKDFSINTKKTKLKNCLNQICAEKIISPINLQPFSNSAMDGFGLDYQTISQASNNKPIKLKIIATIAAGDGQTLSKIAKNECVKIMTGAPIIKGINCIIPIEQAQVLNNQVVIKQPSFLGNNIRKAGEDIKKKDFLLQSGDLIAKEQMMVLTSIGLNKIKVFERLKTCFIATGKELVNDFSKQLKNGQIYNSNLHYAKSYLTNLAVNLNSTFSVYDDPKKYEKIIKNQLDTGTQLFISSGAVSVGQFDFVRNSLEKLGAKIIYHNLAIRPGKPNLLARLPNGGIYFGLPGNPVATAVGLRFLIHPFLKKVYGQKQEQPIYAKLKNSFNKKKGFQFFLKGKLSFSQQANIEVEILPAQQSFMIKPFLKMNCWVIANKNEENLQKGQIVECYLL